jgi:CspA family cold shock protein
MKADAAQSGHPGAASTRRADVRYERLESIMATGTVKFFNTTKGYGFIQPDDGGKDVFVHITAVQAAGMDGLREGQKVSFELVTERGKTAAGNLKEA